MATDTPRDAQLVSDARKAIADWRDGRQKNFSGPAEVRRLKDLAQNLSAVLDRAVVALSLRGETADEVKPTASTIWVDPEGNATCLLCEPKTYVKAKDFTMHQVLHHSEMYTNVPLNSYPGPQPERLSTPGVIPTTASEIAQYLRAGMAELMGYVTALEMAKAKLAEDLKGERDVADALETERDFLLGENARLNLVSLGEILASPECVEKVKRDPEFFAALQRISGTTSGAQSRTCGPGCVTCCL